MIQLTPKQEKLKKKMLNPFIFFLFTLFKVPAVAIAGIRIKSLSGDKCTATVPFKFLNKNPFKSMYFAVQAMAAEISTAIPAMLAIEKHDESFAMLVVEVKAEFFKKGISKVTFTCQNGPDFSAALEKSIQSKQPVTVMAKTVGTMSDGTVVSEFYFTWSFKAREKK
ncbi:MAG: DUF4442 domain-containing protein [Bacteroidetes bacterium]|nr:DUF4442 domain-containing protein [Bacteroidota bacterium]